MPLLTLSFLYRRVLFRAHTTFQRFDAVISLKTTLFHFQGTDAWSKVVQFIASPSAELPLLCMH